MIISLITLVGIYLIYLLYKMLDNLFFTPKQKVKVVDIQNSNIDTMSGVEFERFCIDLLVRSGKFDRAQMTDVNNDYGADIVAVDKEGVRWVFQCKRYKNKVNNKSVQEVIASMAHYKATMAAVITNSWFTDNAKILGNENGVWLVDRAGVKQLEELAINNEKHKEAAQVVGKPSNEVIKTHEVREKPMIDKRMIIVIV